MLSLHTGLWDPTGRVLVCKVIKPPMENLGKASELVDQGKQIQVPLLKQQPPGPQHDPLKERLMRGDIEYEEQLLQACRDADNDKLPALDDSDLHRRRQNTIEQLAKIFINKDVIDMDPDFLGSLTSEIEAASDTSAELADISKISPEIMDRFRQVSLKHSLKC